jgi:hypothetical protein
MVTTYSVLSCPISPRKMRSELASRHSLLPFTLLFCLTCVSLCSAQVTIPAIPTSRGDNQRTGQNINETLLTPANVNSRQFGALFNYPIDYQTLAQPLYVPGVTINGTLHNVVYVATMGDSVYAFDADSAAANPQPLWWVNFTNPANGVTLTSIYSDTSTGVVSLPCAGNGAGTVGFFQEGIAGTPAIDTVGGTLYVVAKTLENGTVVHRLHALDITSGTEKFNGPVVIGGAANPITSTYISPINGQTYKTTFNSLHQLNRPGLLFLTPNASNNLVSNMVYMAFGSNSCNDDSTGWVLSYNAETLALVNAFNDSPEHGLASIWQTGNGIAADETGSNIFVETAETCDSCFDANLGGATYSNSVLELNSSTLAVEDYFTPYDVKFLNSNDEDLSSTGAVVIPDQSGTPTPELVVGGKEGWIYLLDRAPGALGAYTGPICENPQTCDNVLQEFPLVANDPDYPTPKIKDVLFSSPAYWNDNVFFTPNGAPISSYPVLSSGLLGTPLNTSQDYVGAHSPSVSANGTSNGVLWAISGNNLDAFNATTMQLLYSSSQVEPRDKLPLVGHFATQTVVNGKVYVATADTSAAPTAVCTVPPCPAQLSVYGLLTSPTVYTGGNQSATVGTTIPIQVQVMNPYNGAGVDGLTVTFSAKSGTFNPTSGMSMTASGTAGIVSTNYTLPTTAGVISISASVAGGASISFTETAIAGTPTKLIVLSGNTQSAQAGSILPSQLEVKIEDVHSNAVPGITVTFVDQKGLGTLNPTSGVSNASGVFSTSYQLPSTLGAYKITASAAGLSRTFTETATGDAPATLQMVSGNNQTGVVNAALSQPLVVQVNDSGGNPITGVSVVFSAPSGTLSGSPATTNSSGQATVNYTTGTSAGPVAVTASVDRLNTQISVTVTAGSPANVTISGGNNQTAPAGSTLPQALSVVVTDQYGNPVSGIAVTFSDGGVGGLFSNSNPVTTTSTGTASQSYTLPTTAGPVSISAAAAGVNTPAIFSETAQ